MRSVLLSAIVGAAVAGLWGCRDAPAVLTGVSRTSSADCPDNLRDRVRVAASAAEISLSDGLSPQPSTTESKERVARRILISSSVTNAGPAGLQVRGSTLTITTVGGTFVGTASVAAGAHSSGDDRRASGPPMRSNPREVARGRALEIIPGRLRVEPFLSSRGLHSETIALDVTLIPGGAPAEKTVVSLPPLWTSDRRPVSPEALQINTSAERHLTTFDVVDAHVTLDIDGTGTGGTGDTWKCSYETRLTLVDHESVLPDLWDLRTVPYDGKRLRWLALFDSTVGPVRAVFTDARTAQAFATWLHMTGATRAGRYQLGLFDGDASGGESTIPADRDIAGTYQPASVEEVQALTVGRLGGR